MILAPLRVCELVWPAEGQKWADFNDVRMVLLHGDDKEARLSEPGDVYLLNYEGLAWLTGAKVEKFAKGRLRVTIDRARIRAMGFDTLVLDELSKFKNTNTARFQIMKQIVGSFGRRWGLTGSPAANGLMGLFGESYVLDEGRTFGPYITHYRNKYFVPDYNGFDWHLQEGADKKIYQAIKPLFLRMAAEDYLTLPQLVNNTIQVEFPETVRKIYKEMEDDLYTKIERSEIVANNAGVASSKCRQIASGGIYLDPDTRALVKAPKSAREWFNLHTAKIDALEDLLEELEGQPLLVAYDYEHDLDRLRERFGKDVPYLGGGVSSKRAAALVKAWNAGELPMLLGHPQSIGHGLNLQDGGARHVCWHTITWDYELYDQFIRRVLRRGNKNARVVVHHIVVKNSIDEIIMSALKMKESGQQALFKALKARCRARTC